VQSPETIRLHVLGNLQVRVGSTPIPITGRLKHRLLARLALRPGETVEPDGLIEALWGDDAPRTAKQSLHVHISHLRERLRPMGADGLITTTAEGAYALSPSTKVDAAVFEMLVEHGTAAYQVHNLRSALDALHEAVSMWGDPYESLTNHYGAMAQRQRLLAIYERGLDAYVDTLVELGEPERAIPFLRAAIVDEPLRERPYVQLMQIYLAAGEGGLAASLLDTAKDLFREELGTDLSPEFAALRMSIDRIPIAVHRTSNQGHLGFDLSRSALVHIPAAANTETLLEAIRARAAGQNRRVAHGRVVQGTSSPMSPMLEIVGLHDESGVSRAPKLRHQLFDEITHRLIVRHFVTPVVVIERFEHASQLLIEYLERALGSEGPAPFTLVALHSLDPAELDGWAPLQVDQILEQRAAVSLDVPEAPELSSVKLDPVEHLVLSLLSCASPPAASELIARSSHRAPTEVAEAIDRLVLRRIVFREADSRLSLNSAADVDERLAPSPEDRAQSHLLLARALEDWVDVTAAHRVVARARHLMSALPYADWSSTAQAVLAAFDYLESLGAYEEILELSDNSGVEVADWPGGVLALQLWVVLGRAEIRAGRSARGARTLERAVAVARDMGEGSLFADAVRALLEERSPQRFDDAGRALITEALALVGDEASDTRVQLLTDMANSYYFVDLEQSHSWAEQALDLGRKGDSATVARALTGYIQAELRAGNAAQRLELALEAQSWARQANSTESLVLALTYEACALFELGEPRRADPPLRYAEALAVEMQVPRFQWWAAAWRALLDFATGDLAFAEDRFTNAYELWPTSSRADPFECLSVQLATLRIAQGRGAELIPVLERLIDGEVGIEYLAPAAVSYAQDGRPDEARFVLRRLVEHPALQRGDVTVPIALAFGAEAAHLIEDREAARTLLHVMEPLADVHATLNVWGGGGFYWGSLRHGLGLLQLVVGEGEAGRESLHIALDQHRTAGVETFADRTRQVLATLGSHGM